MKHQHSELIVDIVTELMDLGKNFNDTYHYYYCDKCNEVLILKTMDGKYLETPPRRKRQLRREFSYMIDYTSKW